MRCFTALASRATGRNESYDETSDALRGPRRRPGNNMMPLNEVVWLWPPSGLLSGYSEM